MRCILFNHNSVTAAEPYARNDLQTKGDISSESFFPLSIGISSLMASIGRNPVLIN
jgi:hypothetical protein